VFSEADLNGVLDDLLLQLADVPRLQSTKLLRPPWREHGKIPLFNLLCHFVEAHSEINIPQFVVRMDLWRGHLALHH
jgi:hypothetical protein